MPRTHSNIEKIRAELTWVSEPLDPLSMWMPRVACLRLVSVSTLVRGFFEEFGDSVLFQGCDDTSGRIV
jgi:hypothetical protein